MLGLLIKTGVWLATLAALLPFLAWAVAQLRHRHEGSAFPAEVVVLGERFSGQWFPIVKAFRSLCFSSETVVDSNDRLESLVFPSLKLMTLFALLALVPMTGVFMFGETRVSMAVAEPEWSLLWGWILLGTFEVLRCGRHRSPETYPMVLLSMIVLSSAGIMVWVGQASLVEIVQAQDARYALFPFQTTGLWKLAALPAWGIFVQPVGCGLFMLACWGLSERSPWRATWSFDAANPLARLVRATELPVHAAWITALFLGGGALPWLAAPELVSGIGRFYGEGFATAVVLSLQFAVFLGKVVLVSLALAAFSLNNVRASIRMRFLERWGVKLAAIHFFLVIAWLLWITKVIA